MLKALGNEGLAVKSGPPTILVVDTERAVHKLLRTGLGAHGYRIIGASTGTEALHVLSPQTDLVVLELELPDIKGLDLIPRIRSSQEDVSIVVLSNRGDERSKIMALDLGADDFLIKPFSLEELLARIRASLRRRTPLGADKPPFRTGQLSVDLVHRIVKVGDTLIELSPKEYDLLRLLVQHAGKVLTHRFLIAELWDHWVDTQYLRVYVRQLRQKIEVEPGRRYILTHTGVGYRLRPPDIELS